VLDNNKKEVLQVLDAINHAGMSVELNLSGLFRPINDFYPSLDIIELIVEKGIPIVVGSDAHKPERWGCISMNC